MQRTVLIEDHQEALKFWQSYRYQNQRLLHFDAHLDYEDTDQGKLNIGNFLHFAVKEKIVSKIFWVIPGKKQFLYEDVIFLKQILTNANKFCQKNEITIHNGVFRSFINSTPLIISTLDTLPEINKPVLMDIDVDFFTFDRLKNNNPLDNIGKRKPWITEKKFIQIIKKKKIKRVFTTICYSVNGGYTPIIYKTIGDRLAAYLGYKNNNFNKRILAGKNYLIFRKMLDKNKFKQARKYFHLAVSLNRKYIVKDNNYGPLYLMKGDIKNAEKEFKLFLRINPTDVHCLIGMGIVNIYKHQLKKSETYFQQVLKIDKDNLTAKIYLTAFEFRRGNYSLVKKNINRLFNHSLPSIYKSFLLTLKIKLHLKKNQSSLLDKTCKLLIKEELPERLALPLGLKHLILIYE